MRRSRAVSDYLSESNSPSIESFELTRLSASSNSKKRLTQLFATRRSETSSRWFASLVIGRPHVPSKMLLHGSEPLMCSQPNSNHVRNKKNQKPSTVSKPFLTASDGCHSPNPLPNRQRPSDLRPADRSAMQLRLPFTVSNETS